jgi:hypothetical protein
MKATHQKTPYLAEAIQWDGHNSAQVITLINADVRETEGKYLMVRAANDIFTMVPGWWAVKGENGIVKCYSNDVFNVKYQALKE